MVIATRGNYNSIVTAMTVFSCPKANGSMQIQQIHCMLDTDYTHMECEFMGERTQLAWKESFLCLLQSSDSQDVTKGPRRLSLQVSHSLLSESIFYNVRRIFIHHQDAYFPCWRANPLDLLSAFHRPDNGFLYSLPRTESSYGKGWPVQ